MAGLKIVFGGGSINAGGAYRDVDATKAVLKVLEDNGIKNIDTAQLYGESEAFLGEAGAGDHFIIDTKSKGGFDSGNALKPEVLSKLAHESVEKVKVKKFDIFYIHAPDASISPETYLPTINDLYKEGIFSRFGLSNFKPEDVQKVYDISKEKGFVLPSVYQGNYSPVARLQDDTLFPVLKKLKIAFYAYSPLAGGFLTKTKKSIEEGAGRFNEKAIGGMYLSMYVKPSYLEALAEWEQIAKDEGTSKAELAYRWVSYHSPLKPELGDGIIIGASRLEQLEQTIQGLNKGPLKPETVKAVDAVWEKVKHDAPLDNYHSFAAKH
jgi:aflatoxin B1 aldehyde reductase